MADGKQIPTDASRRYVTGALFALSAAIAYSTKAIFVKLAYRHGVAPVTALALRMIIAFPFFAAAALWSRQRDQAPVSRRDGWMVVFLGLAGFYLSAYLDFMGLSYISAGLERLILFLYPTITVLLAWAVFKKAVSRRDVLALALSYAGVALAFTHDLSAGNRDVYTGGALVFACAVTYALYLSGGAEVIGRVGPVRFTAYAMTVSCAAVLVHFAATQPLSALRLPAEVYWLGAGMAVVATVLPTFLMSEGLDRIGAGRGAIVGSAGPVATIFMAWWFLGESVSPAQMAGTALVIAGVLMVARRN